MLTFEQLKQMMPEATPAFLDPFFNPLVSAMDSAEVNTPKRIASFLSQILHECSDLRALSENLNYSAQRLLDIFPNKFTKESAELYKRQPEKIANRVYANRYGNRDEASGDGWKFRGRTPIMLTFHDNYEAVSKDSGVDFVASPDKLLLPEHLFKAPVWYWKNKHINAKADLGDTTGVRKLVNGGIIGLVDTQNRYFKYLTILTK